MILVYHQKTGRLVGHVCDEGVRPDLATLKVAHFEWLPKNPEAVIMPPDIREVTARINRDEDGRVIALYVERAADLHGWQYFQLA